MTSAPKSYPNVITVVNLKGGVGKTTLCVNIAYGLAYFRNLNVLLIDLDPQANATQSLMSQQTYKKLYLTDPPKKLTVVEIYDEYKQAERSTKKCLLENPKNYIQKIYKSSPGRLDLLASKLDLSIIAFEGSGLPKFDQIRWFIESVSDDYDIVIIDCPPTVSKMLYSGIEAAQYLLAPIKPDFLSTIGLPLLHRIITQIYPQYIRRADWLGDLKMLGLVFTMYDNRLKMTGESKRDVIRQAKDFDYYVFNNHLSFSTRLTWTAKHSLPIFRTNPSSKYAHQIKDMCDEFLSRIEALQ